MLANLTASHGLVFSHRLLLALLEAGLERGDAYRLVQRHAMRAWDEERDFAELVRGDDEIRARLDADALAAVFDLPATVQHVDTVFERLALLANRDHAHA
jgi:adenylosuccinate lyase